MRTGCRASREPGLGGRCARAAVLGATLVLGACASLDAVRDFGKAAAAVSVYPQAATAYAESARTSAPFVADSPESFVTRAQREAQVDDALALHAALGAYFATLARLAGDDEFSLATAKSVASQARTVASDRFSRAAINAYAGLGRTLAAFAETPARGRAVKALVAEAGPDAMRVLEALRQVAVDWRAQVANDARQVDDTLSVAVLPADVAPLLRILARDREAELARSYAATLRKMRAADTALATVQTAHAELAAHLDELSGDPLRAQLRRAAAELRGVDAMLASWR